MKEAKGPKNKMAGGGVVRTDSVFDGLKRVDPESHAEYMKTVVTEVIPAATADIKSRQEISKERRQLRIDGQ